MTTQTEHPTTTARDNVKLTRWVATIAGLIGFVLSVATPLLPVVQTTASLNWPQQGQLKSVTAPLISLTPVDFHAAVPCEVVRDMPPTGGVVLGTAPRKGKDANLNALFVVVNKQRVDVTDRNVVILSVPRDQVESPQCQRIDVTSTLAGTYATFVGLKDPGGKEWRSGYPDPNLRPQIVRVSMVADICSPGGAGPLRSVNTPTICGRRLGSGYPLRSSLPPESLSPTKVAYVPASVEVTSMR